MVHGTGCGSVLEAWGKLVGLVIGGWRLLGLHPIEVWGTVEPFFSGPYAGWTGWSTCQGQDIIPERWDTGMTSVFQRLRVWEIAFVLLTLMKQTPPVRADCNSGGKVGHLVIRGSLVQFTQSNKNWARYWTMDYFKLWIESDIALLSSWSVDQKNSINTSLFTIPFKVLVYLIML